ncbi:MAG: 50S ribosomal protein L21 [Magnetococcales bacterium]|nr:50S ribosomal protein L21 [Magnetococcales bacterium]MBF0151842.1 50S ribosomal protein L21 [Magnetococcales bacterium]MBF0172012.1 50S ribosomal protein L21 [Magnetococcales bacterium]MBF0630594.1 50S ribosomal protein L21 [Magnetococcales bacterium]
MYAIVRTGGKQYRVSVNDILRVETLPGTKGDEVVLTDVVLLSDGTGPKTGKDAASAQVTGRIMQQVRAKKVLVFKKRRRKNYRRRQGHRQDLTELKITAIQ